MAGEDSSGLDVRTGFDTLMGQLDHPMYVVTVQGPDGPAGCLVGFASQVSIEPPRFMVGLSGENHTWRVSQQARHLAVHVIPTAHRELVNVFGELSGDRADKFALCSWRAGPQGVPILQDSSAWFVGEILRRIELGDHVGHVLAPVAVGVPRELSEYVRSRDTTGLRPGHDA